MIGRQVGGRWAKVKGQPEPGGGASARTRGPGLGRGRSCAGRSGDAAPAEEPLVVLVGFPDAAEGERSRSSGLHFPLDFASIIIWIYSLLFETGAQAVTPAGLELEAILLPLPPKCCDYRRAARLATRLFLNAPCPQHGLFTALLDVCNSSPDLHMMD